MEELMSAKERKDRIVANIIEDFSLKPRLDNDRGTAILVAASIYDACHYFRLFRNTHFGTHVGIITSYEPNPAAISKESAGSDERYKYDTYKQHVLRAGQTTKQYEDDTKRRFIEEPANMKLLIVVSKLLTGFDAPSCTYVYLDNELHDHNLFQAICRTNRLDGDDKDYGHIVDYKELFGDVQQAIAVYSSEELDIDAGNGGDNNVHLKNWLEEGRKQLDEAREALHYLCEPVPQPREVEQFIHYFCGRAGDPEALLESEALRIAFYKAVAIYLRAFAAIAQNLAEAGYSDAEADTLRREVIFYADVRGYIKNASGEELDIKPYEADMRHLINTYIQAEPAQVLGELAELSLTELIIETGIHDAIAKKLNEKGKLSKNAIAETIINNVRKTIIRDRLTDPRFYEQMSKLLDDLIQQSREGSEAYEAFLSKAEDILKRHRAKQHGLDEPAMLHGNARALVIYRNLPDIISGDLLPDTDAVVKEPQAEYGDPLALLALKIDRVMREEAPAGWRGDEAKERIVQNFLHPLTGRNREVTLNLFGFLRDQGATDGADAHTSGRAGHRRHVQDREECPSFRASAPGGGDAGGPDGHATGSGACLCCFQTALDSPATGAVTGAAPRNTSPVRYQGKSLRLGTPLSALGAGARCPACGEDGSPAHHLVCTPRLRCSQARSHLSTMATRFATPGHCAPDRILGATYRCEGQWLLPATYEDQMG